MPTGYARAMSDTAVLVIDMLNAYRHPDAELLTPNGADIIDPIAGLVRVARDHEGGLDLRQRQLRRFHRRQ